MNDPKKIGIFINLTHSYGKSVLEGILDFYQQQRPGWEILAEMWGDIGQTEALMNGQIDGLICEQASLARGSTVPTVAIGIEEGVPSVATEVPAVVRLVLQHFQERKLEQYAYLAESHDGFSAEVEQELRAQIKTGLSVHYSPKDWVNRRAHEEAVLAGWLQVLPHPVGLFASSDVLARRVLSCARELTLRVPQDLAVLGMGDAELANKLAVPPLSSIVLDAYQIGWQAAENLAGLLGGSLPGSTRVPPKGIVARASSSDLVDPLVVRSLAFIRENLQRGLQVEDVARAVSVSRRWLEQLYQRCLGHTPSNEIRRLQIEISSKLLEETDWPLRVIARECGLSSAERLNVIFKRETGISPGRFRSQRRSLFLDRTPLQGTAN